MLSSEFNQEMGALIRSLEAKVRTVPEHSGQVDRPPYQIRNNVLDDIDAAIVDLIALRLKMQRLSST